MTDELKTLFNTATNVTPVNEQVLHVRVQGKSRDIALDVLGITGGSSDSAIRSAVAQFMDLSPELLTPTVIERHPNGNMTLRPEAVYG